MKRKDLSRGERRRGFTLAELMVVIVIIGLLATLVVPNVVGYLFRANVGIAEAQISSLGAAINNFRINNAGKLPNSLEDLVKPDANNQTYLQDATAVPLDPWGNEYFYIPDANGLDYEVGSYGRDGQPGGEGDSADISNKTLANKAASKKEK